MNILTFDIEDWYNCDFITPDMNWDQYEVRIYEGVDKILEALDHRQIKATFFCLGWIAENHPEVIRRINKHGHHIGCHSNLHELAFRLDRDSFKADTERATFLIEDMIGKKVDSYRAPGFSITENNVWSLEVLAELGYQYDCSIFPAQHDYGGFMSYGQAEPAVLRLRNGLSIREFPINTHQVLGKKIVFSGGGYFRFFPYSLIKKWASATPYFMSYFHTRDFDPGQPMLKSLPLMRKFKSYVGLSKSFNKFQNLLDDFNLVSIEEAAQNINWSEARIIDMKYN
jgi:polysaccharide deacetylase family protein (PEP-CTERM system associated)